MKKILLFIFTVAFGLSSCTVDEPIFEEQYSDAIGFGSYVGKPTTRGAVASPDTLKKNGFTAYAYSTRARDWSVREVADDFFYGTVNVPAEAKDGKPVTWNAGAEVWQYTPIAYWPNEVDGTTLGKVTFFAFSPDSVVTGYVAPTASGTTTPSNPKFNFECEGVSSLQVDLLGDMLVDRTKTVEGGVVKLQFDHLLSKIGFSAELKAHYPNMTITIDSLKVIYGDNGINKNGTYTFEDDYSENKSAAGTWDYPTEPLYMPSPLSGDINPGEHVMARDAAGVITPITLVSSEYLIDQSQLNANNRFLMLIPQVVGPGELSIKISYRIISGTPGIDPQLVEATMPLPFQLWEIGKQYNYKFIISLEKVEFGDVTIDDWEDGDLSIESAPEQVITRDDISNCYIVSPHAERTTKLRFPAVSRVNEFWGTGGDDGSTARATYPYGYGGHNNAIGANDTWYAEIIWADFDYQNSVKITQNSSSTAGQGTDELLEVVLSSINHEGNVIVGLKKSSGGDYLWSWHIWISDFVSTPSTTFVSPSNRVVMDRNLGATSPLPSDRGVFGLMYQWGRKDPFPTAGATSGPNESVIYTPAGFGATPNAGGEYATTNYGVKSNAAAASIDVSIANPLTFYAAGVADWVTDVGVGALDRWNVSADGVDKGTKSIFDPCPDGWRMPFGADWSEFTIRNFPWNTSNVVGRRFTAGGGAGFFAAGGYRTEDTSTNPGGLMGVGDGGYSWSGSPSTATHGSNLSFNENQMFAKGVDAKSSRSRGMSIRPVSTTDILETVVDKSDDVSNCYIIEPTSSRVRLIFPAVTRVNEFWASGREGSIYPYGHVRHSNAIGDNDKWFAEVVWADFDYTDRINILQDESGLGVGNEHLEIVFNDIPQQGNVVIGLKKATDPDNYLWSWHIWISDFEFSGATFNIPRSSHTDEKVVMDRNLGARSAIVTGANTDTYGLLFQWGRKDAFPGAGVYNENVEATIYTTVGGVVVGAAYAGHQNATPGTIDNAVNNPLNYYGFNGEWVTPSTSGWGAMDRWNNTGATSVNAADYQVYGAKTIFDPCPEGWRLPWNENWNGFDEDNFRFTTESGVNGRTYEGAPAGTGFFPTTGFRSGNSGILIVVDAIGFVWSSAPRSVSSGHYVSLSIDELRPGNAWHRSNGMSIRPVKDIPPTLAKPDEVITHNETANSYIVPFSSSKTWPYGDIKTYQLSIPAVERVNEYWNGGGDIGGVGEYPYGFSGHANVIDGNDTWYAEVVWADFDWNGHVHFLQTAQKPGEGIEDLDIFIRNAPSQGNVVVGLKKIDSQGVSTGYLWSWHIWITDFTGSDRQTFTTPVGTSGAKVAMDRNLGARSAGISSEGTDAFGLMYQWGRKDAFPGSGSATDDDTESTIWNSAGNSAKYDSGSAFGVIHDGVTSIENSIGAPMTFNGVNDEWVADSTPGDERFDRWQKLTTYSANGDDYDTEANKGTKSIFDPCPPGWRMPWGKDWTGFPASSDSAENEQFPWSASPAGSTFTAAGDKGWFPATGYRASASGTIGGIGTEGNYWSGSPGGATYGYRMNFNGSGVHPSSNNIRSYGFTVRPVRDVDGSFVPPVVNLTEYNVDQVSNSYIVPATLATAAQPRTLRFPAAQRVNQFWRDGGTSRNVASEEYPYGFDEHANSIGATDTWTAEVIWADFAFNANEVTFNSASASNATFTGLEPLEVKIASTVPEGNVIVGVKKTGGSGEYIWSWHIWISDVSEANTFTINKRDASASGVTPVVTPVMAKTVMDRNLGAKAAGQPAAANTDTFGMLYQWGRKDAIPGSSSATTGAEPTIYTDATQTTGSGVEYGGATYLFPGGQSTIVNSLANPVHFYGAGTTDWATGAGALRNDRWNVLGSHNNDAAAYDAKGAKSIFDPCPVGWRVPWGIDWNGIVNATAAANFALTTHHTSVKGRTLIMATGTHTGATADNAWFPASGCRHPDSGVLIHVSTLGFGWSGSPGSATYGYYLQFNDSAVSPSSNNLRSHGFPIRPVRE